MPLFFVILATKDSNGHFLMIQQLFFALLIIALGSFLVVQGRRRRIWSVILLLAALFFMYNLWEALSSGQIGFFVYSWLPDEVLNAHFYLSSSLEVEQTLFALLGILIGLVYLNIVYQNEQHSLNINTLLLLNFSALIILVSARDFIQFMAGSCAFSILSFYMVNDMAAKSKFVFYNFWAEMAVFTALALVYGETGSIVFDDLEKSASALRHPELAAGLLAAAVCVKAGMFPFQNQMLDFQHVPFNRAIDLSLLSTPLAALFMWAKLSPLLSEVAYIETIMKTIVSVSAFWAVVGCMLADNIKAKTLYFNMLFWSFALSVVGRDVSLLYSGIVYLLPFLTILNVLMLMITVSASNEIYVSQMGGFCRNVKFTFFLSMLAVLGFVFSIGEWKGMCPKIYLGLALLALACCFNGVFLGKENADERVSALLGNSGILYWFPLLLVIAGSLYLNWAQSWEVYAVWGCFLVAMAFFPQKICRRWADSELLQDGDIVYVLYRIFLLSPLRLLGRVLWIAVDFVVIERSIIGSISQTSSLLVSAFHRMQEAAWLNYLLLVFVGLLLILINWGYYGHG